MSELQPSPDLQVLFDRLDEKTSHRYGSGVITYERVQAQYFITEWAKQRDAEKDARLEDFSRRYEIHQHEMSQVMEGLCQLAFLVSPACGSQSTWPAAFDALRAERQRSDEELAHCREVRERLSAQVADQYNRHEAAMAEVLTERDGHQELLDQLAYHIAPQEEIGEHSSGNSPWHNAFDALDGERQRHDEELAALREENERSGRDFDRARDLLAEAVRTLGPQSLTYSIDEFLGETMPSGGAR